MILTPYAIPPLLAAVLNLSVSAWVWREAPAGTQRRTFMLWNFWMGLWNASIAVGYCMAVPAQAFDWYRWTIPPAIAFITPFFLHFTVTVTQDVVRTPRWLLPFAYASGIFFTLLGTGNTLLIRPAPQRFWGAYPLAGSWAWLFGAAYLFLSGYSFFLYIRAIPRLRGVRRNQLQYLLFGTLLCFGSGATNFLPLYGVEVYPLGNLMNSAYSLIAAYTIIRFELMDIRLALRHGTVYTIVSTALMLVYAAVFYGMQRLFSRYGGFLESALFYSAVVPITVALAPSLKARIEPWVKNVPFWRTPWGHLRDIGSSIGPTDDLEAVAKRTLENASTLFRVNEGAVYRLGQDPDLWIPVAALGPALSGALGTPHPISRQLLYGRRFVVKEKLLWQLKRRPSTPENVQRRLLIEAWPYAIVVGLEDRGNLVGFLALGEKASGNMFNQEDLHVLRQLGRSLSAALHHRLRTTALASTTQPDLAILSVVAKEMAHELSRPLTHIMNAGSRLEPEADESTRQSFAKIEQEVQRASEILDSFVMLSPQSQLQRESVSLADLMEKAIAALGIADDPAILLERDYALKRPANVHPGQIVQVFTNLLQNACEAMPDGGRLRIALSDTFSATGPGALVHIEDEGRGIPPETMSRLFDLFFSTKKGAAKHGIGLSLSRAMIERHGGTLRLESPISAGRGTRVVVQLPLDM